MTPAAQPVEQKLTRFQIYQNYMRGPDWRELRHILLKSKGWKCEHCSSSFDLVGHHMIYRDPLTDCTLDDLMCLCMLCHDCLHRGLSKARIDPPNTREKTKLLIETYKKREERRGYIPKTKKQKDFLKAQKDQERTLIDNLRRKYRQTVRIKDKRNFSKEQILEVITRLDALYKSLS